MAAASMKIYVALVVCVIALAYISIAEGSVLFSTLERTLVVEAMIKEQNVTSVLAEWRTPLVHQMAPECLVSRHSGRQVCEREAETMLFSRPRLEEDQGRFVQGQDLHQRYRSTEVCLLRKHHLLEDHPGRFRCNLLCRCRRDTDRFRTNHRQSQGQ
ncbi:hypothetical protein Mapa_002059 [Marchantia paleacea]|nr:hypothetical protein Mapa_002059 [Marchantia paleacea]